MAEDSPTAPITIRAAPAMIHEIDAIAAAMDRSRNYVINQALRFFLDAFQKRLQAAECNRM